MRARREKKSKLIDGLLATAESLADGTSADDKQQAICDATRRMMEGMDGFELATQVRAANPQLPVIFVSAYFPAHRIVTLPGTGSPGLWRYPCRANCSTSRCAR